MKMSNEINSYCPKCKKHTLHSVKSIKTAPGASPSGLSVGTRRYERKHQGYVGKVKGAAERIKLGMNRSVLLKCKVCGYGVDRVVGARAKKTLEIKAK